MKPAAAIVSFSLAAAGPAQAALVVSKAATSNVACVSGICTATAADAVLNVGDLKHMLAAGDATLVSGSTAEDIAFDAKLQWTKPSRLTLDAWRGIAISLDITSEGSGGVTLTTNDGGSGGDLVFTNKGKVSFWDISSSLIIDGTAYTLVDSIQGLASAAALGSTRYRNTTTRRPTGRIRAIRCRAISAARSRGSATSSTRSSSRPRRRRTFSSVCSGTSRKAAWCAT